MDGELVSSEPSEADGSGYEEVRALTTYTQQFYEEFPKYLAMGMTPEQYWDGDPSLAKYYRKAEEIRNEKRNQELWLQGMYVYDAILCASPILHAFAKKGTRAVPYPSQPYALTAKARKTEASVKEKQKFNKGKQYMERLMASTNKKFEE